MTGTISAAMRRSNRRVRRNAFAKATRSFQTAMAGFMVDSAIASFGALGPKTAKTRKGAAAKAGRSLGSAVAQLRAAQSLVAEAGAGSAGRVQIAPRIPHGAQYLARRHRSPAGTRDYKLYLPASHPKRPKGLILMLHGCSQDPDDFAAGTHMNAIAEKHGLAVVYPAQTNGHNAASCWNWFRPGHQLRGMGEPALLASLTRKLVKELGLERDATFVAGLSAGGAMAAILADVYPDLFSAAGVHSGLARGSARDVISALSAMRSGGALSGNLTPAARTAKPVRRIVFHGDSDRTVHASNASVIVLAAVGELALPVRTTTRTVRGCRYARSDYVGVGGDVILQLWMLEGGGHAWSGGRAAGSYTDSKGPDASAQMVRFFLTKSA